jgi:hypothetical protein
MFQHFEARPGISASFLENGHPFSVHRMPPNLRPNITACPRKDSAENGQIDFLHFSSGELARQGKMSRIIFGNNQAAARILVQTMDNARARYPANAAQLAVATVQQRIDERMFFMACGWMHHHSRRLVHYQEVLVFEENGQRYRLRLGIRDSRLRPMHFNNFSSSRVMGRLYGLPIDPDVSLLDQPLESPSRDGGKLRSQINIEPFRWQRRFHNHRVQP